MTQKSEVHGLAKFNNVYLAKLNDVYRLTVGLADRNGHRVFYTEDGDFAENVLDFTRKVVSEANKSTTMLIKLRTMTEYADDGETFIRLFVVSTAIDEKTESQIKFVDQSDAINFYFFLNSIFLTNLNKFNVFVKDTSNTEKEIDKMAKITLDLVKFQSGYRVVAKVDGETLSYTTKDESLAEDVLNFTRKVVNAADETDDTPIFDTGKTADGDYMILATIGDVEHYLNVETQISAYEIFNFLIAIFEED